MPVTTARPGRRLTRHVAFIALVSVLRVGCWSTRDGAGASRAPLAAMRQPPATGIVGCILAKQALFYRELSGLIRAAKTDGSALWGLIGVSFIYGIFHAAGPGHGKAVISSYLVANEETWRRGVMLSFASALLQAVTAVVIVTVAAVLIGATAKMMGDTVRVIETRQLCTDRAGRARLLWVKGRAFLHTLLHACGREPRHRQRRIRPHDHGHCAHHHDHAHESSSSRRARPWHDHIHAHRA